MSASALPQELIDEVIDAAAGDDLKSMKALGLVCRQWTRRTRKHLFKIIDIRELSNNPVDPATRCKRLAELLEVNRDLCKHPRVLVIQSSTACPDAEEKDRKLGWIQVCSEDLIKVIEMLQGVLAVFLWKGEKDLNFFHLSSSLSAALHSLVSRPTITELVLRGVPSIEMTPLLQQGSIRHLFIALTHPQQAEIDAYLQATATVAPLASSMGGVSSKKYLQTLDVSGPGIALRLLLHVSRFNAQSTLDFTQISSLTVGSTIGWDREMDRIWPTFLRVFCQNVRNYSVKSGPWKSVHWSYLSEPRRRRFNPVIFSFTQLPRLIRLDIEIAHYSLEKANAHICPWPHLWAALATLGSSPEPVPLKYLTLEFNFGSLKDLLFNVTLFVAHVPTFERAWRRLDGILSRREVFSHLTEVIVDMNLSRQCEFDQSVEELDTLRNGILSYMPKLAEQSIVKVVFNLPS